MSFRKRDKIMNIKECFDALMASLQKSDGVLSIGKSGGEKLPEKDESDIDIFVICDSVPSVEERQNAVESLGDAVTGSSIHETAGRFWGVCDFIFVSGADICLMYFTAAGMDAEIETVLNGSRLNREDEYFYPTGRCASFLSMHILCDKTGYIAGMKKRLADYPRHLAEMQFNYHIKKINDAEDFSRAVSRGDVLFYHAVLESALDHYLQALFALNRRYFPGRKRSLQFIEQFDIKPDECAFRLLRTIELGASEETLHQSYKIWSALCDELKGFFV